MLWPCRGRLYRPGWILSSVFDCDPSHKWAKDSTNWYLSRSVIKNTKWNPQPFPRNCCSHHLWINIYRWMKYCSLFISSWQCSKINTLWHYSSVIMCINLGTTLSWTSYSVAERDWSTFCIYLQIIFCYCRRGKMVHSRTLTNYNTWVTLTLVKSGHSWTISASRGGARRWANVTVIDRSKPLPPESAASFALQPYPMQQLVLQLTVCQR